MKLFFIILVITITWACHRQMEKWPYDGDKQDVTMYVRTRSLSGIAATPTTFQLFIYDSQKTMRYNVNANPDNNLLDLKLFPGSYTGYCVTHAPGDDFWIYSENNSPEQIFLKSQKKTTDNSPASDHLLATSSFTVEKENTNHFILDFNRKVGMLRVNIENIPDWLSDLQINLTDIPKQMNLLGEYSTETYRVTKDITLPSQGKSVTDILVFPPPSASSLTLTSKAQAFISTEYPISKIEANKITEIKAIFQTPDKPGQIEFTTRLIEWSDEVIREPDWKVDLPEGPCQGVGNGINLLTNGDFENDFVENQPPSWQFSNEGSSKSARQITTPVYEGNKAICLNGKTYLYQDIPVTGGQCYQMRLFAHAPNHNVSWRCRIAWMQGSENISTTQYPLSGYYYENNGYQDPLEGLISRAPAKATKLRIEIRTYMKEDVTDGLYVDAASIEAVN